MTSFLTILFLKMKMFYLFLAAFVSIAVCRLSLVAVRSSCSRVAAQTSHRSGFSLAEQGLTGTWASVVVVHRLRCPVACGVFLD